MLTKKDLLLITSIVRTELKPIKRMIRKVDKTSTAGLKILDRDYVHTSKRVDRIEDHLGLPPLKRVN